MAARKTSVTAPEVEEMATVTDDVYEPEQTEDSEAPAKRGRKADPFTAAVKELKEAKAAVELARQAPPLDEAEARFEAAKENMRNLMGE